MDIPGVQLELPKTKKEEEFDKHLLTNRYCFKCKRVTKFGYCDNCGKFFCLAHALEEVGGDWESGYTTYLAHDCR